MAEEQRPAVELTPEIKRAVTRELGQQGAASRERIKHTCPVCGTEFQGLKTARYCSAKCRVKAFYDENRGQVLAQKKRRRNGRAAAADAVATAPASGQDAPSSPDGSAAASLAAASSQPAAPAGPEGP